MSILHQISHDSTNLSKQNAQQPVCLPHLVDTYPVLSLSDLGCLADLGLGEQSWIDVYVDSAFKTFQWQAAGSIIVEKGYPVVIRLRPTLLEELTDCPGLAEYLDKQPKARAKGKRSAEPLVSPIKTKTPRLSAISGA